MKERIFDIGTVRLANHLSLAPMEDVTDPSFRAICKEFGADLVYTEFVNAEGLIRKDERTAKKMAISREERPAGVQIYGERIAAMVEAARMAEEVEPEFIDINAGCWVKKIARRGAGAGLLRDLPYLQRMVEEVVRAVAAPVTVKTRIGWDLSEIKIVEAAKRVEEAGAKALVVHCRTRSMGHGGEPLYEWIDPVKEAVSIPVVVNGGLFEPEDVKRVFEETAADGAMIARGAIGRPWIFRETKQLLEEGRVSLKADETLRIDTCLDHLKRAIEVKGERRAVLEHRKYYAGYLKGLRDSSLARRELVLMNDIAEIEDALREYQRRLVNLAIAGYVVDHRR
jgi:tRNA-dihydrouridine synthase B